MQSKQTQADNERRRHPRHSVRHAALAAVDGLEPIHVVVENYCPGGLFVSLMEQIGMAEHPEARQIQTGQPLTITIQFDDDDSTFEGAGTIARVGDLGFGLAFEQSQDSLANHLRHVARSQGFDESAKPVTSGKSEVLRTQIERITLDFADKCMADALEASKDDLLTAAGNATSDTGQAPFFEALSLLNKSAKAIGGDFHRRVADHLLSFATMPPLSVANSQSDDGELSLVDEEEFETWLSLSEIIASIENRNHEQLHGLEARLSELTGMSVNARNNPLSSGSLCHHFYDAVLDIQLNHAPSQVIWRAFGKELGGGIRALYEKVNKLLIDSGILPNLVFTQVRPRRANAPRGQGATQMDHAPMDGDGTASAAADAYSASGADYANRAPMGDQYLGNPPATNLDSSKLMDLQRLLGVSANTPVGAGGRPQTQPGGPPPLTMEELQQALVQIKQAHSSQSGEEPQHSLAQRLSDTLKAQLGDAQQRPIAEQHSQAVDLADQMLSSIKRDAVVEPQAKEWISSLEVQLLKLLLSDQDLLNDPKHPARQVLDHLGQAVVGRAKELSGREQKLIDQIDTIVAKLGDVDDPNRESFAQAATQLESLLKRQHRLRATQLKRVLEAAEGQQKLEQARTDVTQKLSSRFGGREVPKPITDLLEMGYRNLLDVAAVRSGTKGKEWDKVYKVLEQLDQRLSPDHQPEQEDSANSSALVEEITERLDHVRADTGERDELVATLRDLLPGIGSKPAGEVEHEVYPAAEPPPQTAAEAAAEDDGTAELDPGDPDEAHWLGLAKLLDKGSWVLYPGPDGKTQPIKLAWISEDRERYVFVNRNGQKALEIGQSELAGKFREKEANLIDQPDQPLMDRTWHGMVQHMHDQISHQATHDQLTESLNRREFERKIRLKLGESKLMHTQHIALQMEVDQFKVVNTTAGHDAGDQVLQDLSRVIRRLLPEEGELARLGGDTFAMLFPRMELAPGHELAEKIRRAINEHRTRWKRRKIKVTVSIGLVTINRDSDSVSQILNQLENACSSAKDTGRDRIKSYEIDDQELSQRDQAMNWVSELESALEQDRIVLYGQRIMPLNGGDENRLHYEVLCRMQLENGELIGPDKFIPAAEAYGRIHSLDEWVFRNSFAALLASPISDRIARLSINLSGKTFSRPRFMNYIQKLFEDTGMEPSKICFEITETSAISNLARCTDFLRELRYLGCRFSLDDFGTGLSSFSYLKHLPVDYLKIDGSFIKDVVNSTADYGLVKTINEIGHFLGKETIAEFVENDEILAHLRDIGLDFVQGYGIERPKPLNELLQLETTPAPVPA